MTNSSQIRIHDDDSAFITLKAQSKGTTLVVGNSKITLKEDVPQGHKVALKPISKGEDIYKYGYPIGIATEAIGSGEWIHSHNMKTKLEGLLDYEYQPSSDKAATYNPVENRTFKGYIRDNGEVGIRNEIWIVNTVGCINKTAELLAKMGQSTYDTSDGIDGIYNFPHPYGCSQLGDDLQNTQKILGDFVNHPNAAGVLVIGLGCENNNIKAFKEIIGHYDPDRVKFLFAQEAGDEIEEGLQLIGELVEKAATYKRQDVPISKLKVGLKCGGSDGFSGITANPLVGAFSDMLIEHGGTTILTEVPEMFGAEHVLMERAADEKVFNDLVRLVNGFKEYFIKHDQEVYENPSPGNKDGGITTLEEKSLGCVQKGGFAKVEDIIPYGSRVSKNGLNIVQGPGNDLVSVSTLAAAGAHIVLFTTGRGTPYGGPVPTVKMSTNNQLYEKKKNWIDFNAGPLAEDIEMETIKRQFFDYIVDVASGKSLTKNEQNGFKEIAIFKDGVTL
ncbi:UxaA family hydrolase [Tuberibacillus sp. Marseille-P3662]|uniref:UxaA family hydrolase n=1 Tax=Tuberibacillus sp. Marseille-P3662 TaxID=1965358 RepID=UPI000A1CC415|nr:altronate dehydratase family protein [Tuberibacillus sp. Marseille-P3662]